MSIDVCAGSVCGAWLYARSNTTLSFANPSRTGVRPFVYPYTGRWSARRVSIEINTTAPGGTGRRYCHATATAPATSKTMAMANGARRGRAGGGLERG